jgi:hypothetical protein
LGKSLVRKEKEGHEKQPPTPHIDLAALYFSYLTLCLNNPKRSLQTPERGRSNLPVNLEIASGALHPRNDAWGFIQFSK